MEKMPEMKMADMKMSAAEKKRMFGQPTAASMAGLPDYAWGLSITLDAAALKKLGITELPEAGEKCMIHAMGKITRVSESQTSKITDRSIEIQVMKLAVACEDSDEKMWAKVSADRKAKG